MMAVLGTPWVAIITISPGISAQAGEPHQLSFSLADVSTRMNDAKPRCKSRVVLV
jgi:hypothetical protein